MQRVYPSMVYCWVTTITWNMTIWPKLFLNLKYLPSKKPFKEDFTMFSLTKQSYNCIQISEQLLHFRKMYRSSKVYSLVPSFAGTILANSMAMENEERKPLLSHWAECIIWHNQTKKKKFKCRRCRREHNMVQHLLWNS